MLSCVAFKVFVFLHGVGQNIGVFISTFDDIFGDWFFVFTGVEFYDVLVEFSKIVFFGIVVYFL